MIPYADYTPLTFHDAARRFTDGNDSPRAYLERCLETIAQREPVVKALVALNETGARAAADASAARWKAGKPLSPIDGMPVGIKDLLETRDMPTEMGCAAMKGNFPKRDNAGVWALRQAGAVILAKTVTAELGGSQPGPTTNPFDPARTPGRLVLGLGRRRGRQHDAGGDRHAGRRLDHPAGRLLRQLRAEADARRHQSRRAARHQPEHARAARRLPGRHVAGRDRDGQALRRRPRLARPDGARHAPRRDKAQPADRAGDRRLGRASTRRPRRASPKLLSQLEAAGVTLIRRADHPFVEALEKAIANGRAVCNGVTSWENRWYQRGMLDAAPDGISARGQATLQRAEAMTPDDYRTGLLARQQAQLAHMAVASLADAAITLACPGPAPLWSGDVAGQPLAPRPTGDFVFNAPSSMLFAPVVTVPLMSVGGLPVGVQLMGQQHEDARMTGLARWFVENLKRVAAPA